jgi:hypothetical protein
MKAHESQGFLRDNSVEKDETRATLRFVDQLEDSGSRADASRATSFIGLKVLLDMWGLYRSGSLWAFLFLMTGIPPVRAEVIDRIVAVVNQQVITLGDVEQEEKFQDLGLVADPLAEDRKETQKLIQSEIIHKLIQQRLIRDQVLSFPGSEVNSSEVERQMEALKQKWGGEQQFQRMLAGDDISLDGLRQRLEWQMQVLKFLDSRFRQFVVVEPKEIEEYYTKEFLPELAKRGETINPPLTQVEEQIRQIIAEDKINAEVDSWLKSLTQSATISIFD